MNQHFDDEDLLGAEALTALQFMHDDFDLGHADEVEREHRAIGRPPARLFDDGAADADFDLDEDFDAEVRSALRELMALT